MATAPWRRGPGEPGFVGSRQLPVEKAFHESVTLNMTSFSIANSDRRYAGMGWFFSLSIVLLGRLQRPAGEAGAARRL
jgi:hypothetical protein